MVSFARKASNIHEDLKKSSSGGGAGYLRGIKAGKDLRVRFLQDPTEWLEFREHYAKSTGFFPCGAEDGYCGGCESDDDQMRRAGTKYIAQVLVQHEDGAKDIGQVKALKVPRTLANRLTARAERNGGTLLNRDYTIIRSGQGIDTEYDVETEDKAPLDLSKYAHVDVDAILSQMWEENAPKAPLRSVPTEVPATVDNRKARVPSVTETMLAAAPAPATEEDTPPFDPAPEQGATVESGPVTVTPVSEPEDQVLDEQYLRSLHIDNLCALLDKFGVTVPDTIELNSASAIVDYVVETYGA